MQKLKALFSVGKREVAIGSALLLTSGATFAAEGDLDITKPLLYIAGGVTAAVAVTAAMFGLGALIGAAKKAQRSGT
ncbi:hypothetical protein [Azotobacter beijerinckii]|uniref:Bacteriophage coat protein B n=1 Tax=Azotobacter beijerinckii TaxID=170623 RepID=A0A1I1CNW2_9GAMM|nr:hypothetical protein [Azotobacter beijerinckii]SFB64167.1 hypothetical protein SAMN04244571_04645 [Azotobacter beijerinckii]